MIQAHDQNDQNDQIRMVNDNANTHKAALLLLGDTRSDWQEVRRGVPQGSVLGPMFFNIFINDLFLHIKTVQLNMYADDGQLYTADTDPVSLERRISCEVSSANAW